MQKDGKKMRDKSSPNFKLTMPTFLLVASYARLVYLPWSFA